MLAFLGIRFASACVWDDALSCKRILLVDVMLGTFLVLFQGFLKFRVIARRFRFQGGRTFRILTPVVDAFVVPNERRNATESFLAPDGLDPLLAFHRSR